MRRHGFILIMVIGLVGVYAILGIQFVSTARLNADLSRHEIQGTRARLMARSGYEHALRDLTRHLEQDLGWAPSVEGSPIDRPWGIDSRYQTRLRDLNGALDLNDGLSAGQMEHAVDPIPGGYQANALDPWPPGAIPGTFEFDRSALINLRMRRLLNAYGDAHRFVATIGWPAEDNYGRAFDFTATAAGRRYTSMPAGPGLGDTLLSTRPANGWDSTTEIREIVNDWGKTHLSSDYLQGRPLYDVVSLDLTTSAVQDTRAHRLVREFGPDLDGNGWPDFPDSPLDMGASMSALDRHPPDLSDPWRPHAVSTIQFNAASEFVRAAVLYAPVNISLVAEGILTEGFPYHSSGTGVMDQIQVAPTLGVGSLTYRSSRMTENGDPDSAQKRRMISLRDALLFARGWSDYCVVNGPCRSFSQFPEWIREITWGLPEPEREDPYEPYANESQQQRSPLQQAFFKTNVREHLWPQLFSSLRRLPGWLGGPLASMTPLLQEGGRDGFGPHDPPPASAALKSAEDFVWKMHLPKVTFITPGRFEIVSSGLFRDSRAALHCQVEVLQQRISRSQQDFLEITAEETSPLIRLGPEPRGSPASHVMGCVGMIDRDHPVTPATAPHQIYYGFDGTLEPQTDDGSDRYFTAKNPDTDDVLTAPPAGLIVRDLPPAPYPEFLPAGLQTPYDPDVLLTLRDPSTSPPLGETWKVPLPGDQALESLGQSVESLDVLYAFHQDYPHDGSSDEKAWFFFDLNGIPWDLWPFTWKDGIAENDPPPGNDIWHDSHLEDETVSMFSHGSHGSDLSAYGGILLSARGHGPRAPGYCNDSLYFRPMDLLDTTSGQTPGAIFNQMTVSCWVRVPSGYQWKHDQRTIFHLTLWETVQQQTQENYEFGNPFMPPPSQLTHVTRPVSMSAHLKGVDHNDRNWDMMMTYGHARTPTSGTQPHPPWSEDYPLSVIPFPPGGDITTPSYAQVLGSTSDPMQMNNSRHSGARLFTDFRDHLSGIHKNGLMFRAPLDQRQRKNRPGSWRRLSYSWNLAQHTPPHYRLMGFDHRDNSALGWAAHPFVHSFNPHMILAIGETPTLLSHDEDSLHPMNYSSFTSPLKKNGLYPLNRLNSCIDNLMITVGQDSGLGSNHFDYNDAIQNTDFKSKRYKIGHASQPEWVIAPGLEQGDRLMGVSSRISDPDFIRSDPDLSMFRDPSITVSLTDDLDGDGSTEDIPVLGRHAGRDRQGIMSLQKITVRSADCLDFGGHPVHNPDLARLTFRYVPVNPNGDLIDPLVSITDIPWIHEVTVHSRPREPRILTWETSLR